MNDKKNIIILSIIFLVFSIIFYAKTGNPLVDFPRESYLPYQLNNGEKLIQDIFLIYGPFGYIFNSFLYKISTNFNILFLETHLISYSILILFYFIIRKFTKEKIALIFSIILISISIFSNSTFSFTIPYSFSGLWGFLGGYLALFCLLYDRKNILFLSLGLVFSNKIELFVPLFIISIIYLIYKKENFIKNIPYLFIFPFISYGLLFWNNFSLEDITQNFAYLAKMTKTNSIAVLYKGVGAFFEIEYLKYNLILLAKLAAICAISYFAFLKNKKILSYTILIIGISFLNLEFALNLSGFLIIILTGYTLYKKTTTKEELLLVLFSLFMCSKSFFATNSLSYSNFGFVLLIFVLFLKLKSFINKKWLLNSFIIFFSLLFISKMIIYYYDFKTKVETPIGAIWLNKQEANLANKTNEFIKNNIKENENFVVIPEGQIFNLIHKKPYGFYNTTFTPLDFDTFEEKNITQRLKENKTDYVIYFPRNTIDYGAKMMCYDYAVDFCNYIIDNYTKIDSFGEYEKVNIYKIKK